MDENQWPLLGSSPHLQGSSFFSIILNKVVSDVGIES
jgi:hypothetical protein